MQVGNYQIALEKIEKYDKIVIFHHQRPDGDCLGSQYGLREAIRINYPNKKVCAVGDDKGLFKFLGGKHDEVPSMEFIKEALAIIVDANYKGWIEFAHLLKPDTFKETLRIDHHPNEDDLDNVTRWVDSSYIAGAEMVAELALRAKWKLTPKALNFIYLGIHTDSGALQFQNTSSRTMRIVAELMDKGCERNMIIKNLMITPKKDLRYNSFLQSSFKTYGKVAYIVITKKDLKKYDMDTLSGMRANIIGNIEGHPIWVTFLEEEKDQIRVEFRSNGPIVRNVAVKWGGGGHEHACGCMIKDFKFVEDIIKDCDLEANK
ncbi:Bifunctional oligoribonuclease and PAP phosphatase nrnA [Mycoplasmopsis californica]|uniref:Bifunctional oligoribonuclease/PAP phosphatase NrnA n=1 Tax=Mycoplasmopsis equigenitalium TaxID=114883 RepID=A0ABY5J0T4_9BACT|nr:bifunctional oligoribonuclease/PAP phosphatase NrnA [Mycoplasmopsis equigenitalium]UUD36868.1 bifunctional oligoribonuclease/PAP phosphatase NrnA [Mycoplasmopsis equigenitalium]VEU69837.1 Bifunctional oligoribonuclease and PAP phosphatase nrnA [Mycoplasmopsis californica]